VTPDRPPAIGVETPIDPSLQPRGDAALVQAPVPEPQTVAPAASAAPAAGAQGADRAVQAQHVIDQIVDAMEILARDQGHEVRLRLRPPELGELRIRMDVHGSAVRLSVTAEHEHVSELLRSHMPGLRDALAQREIHVERADVWTGGSMDDARPQYGGEQGQPEDRPAYALSPWERETPRPAANRPPRQLTSDDGRVDYRV
jgi:flagellar hook-length control protein FliK